MRKRFRRLSFAMMGLTLTGSIARADRTVPAKPLYSEVRLRTATRGEKISGNLTSYDDATLTITSGKTDHQLKWAELTASSAFTLRSRLIDKTKAADWFVLAEFGWSIGATEQTHTAIGNAEQLDPTYKSKADRLLATPSGSAINAELIGAVGHTKAAPASRPSASMSRPDDGAPAKPTHSYQTSTPEQNDAAIAASKQMSAKVEAKFAVHFTTLETPHFLIFTDWDSREFDFLKANFEDAYKAVSEQFNIPATDNIFIGKLPVLMFTRFSDYAKLTDSIGFLGTPVTRSLRGYYEGKSDGSGRMVMYKPASEEREEAEKEWAHVLVHEFTHAFVARYRTNARIPRWLNEGVAEVIAARHFSFPGTYPYAKRMAAEAESATELFDDNVMPGGEWYPVMQTMVEYLIARDRDSFLKMFNAIKDGSEGEDALQKFYQLSYPQLVKAWRLAVLHSNG